MKRKIEFASHPANLWLVRHCVRQFLQDRPFTTREIELMVLGVDEACTNIIRHAYHLAEDQLICLSLEAYRDGVRFRLRDYGDSFDGTRYVSRSLGNNLQPGGLGMHLIRHAFDHVDYLLKRKGTLLVLTKLKSKSPAVAPSPALV
ncbi:MAG: ATP-binding protein [Verrucomicrobia bacterium]|nr:ATP-binding protein [Verrucomicrobiota bacterium]